MVELPEIVRGRFQWESLWAEKSPCRSVGWLTGCVRCDGGDFEVREYGEAAVDHCGSRHRDSQLVGGILSSSFFALSRACFWGLFTDLWLHQRNVDRRPRTVHERHARWSTRRPISRIRRTFPLCHCNPTWKFETAGAGFYLT